MGEPDSKNHPLGIIKTFIQFLFLNYLVIIDENRTVIPIKGETIQPRDEG
jgi:hypothetical protein